MRAFDFSPLFRSTVGFDRMQRMLDQANRVDESQLAYPPYNIEKRSDDSYRISMAIAGFSRDDVDITVENGTLTVSGRIMRDEEDAQPTFLHQGIALRAFERRFELVDHIKVVGADLVDGMLHIELEREVPEAMKPRKIAIGTEKVTGKGRAKKIEGAAA